MTSPENVCSSCEGTGVVSSCGTTVDCDGSHVMCDSQECPDCWEEETVEEKQPEKGTVYVIVETEWESGDTGGCLLADTGAVLWGHLSSNLDWLKRDLTSGFSDRREKLEHLYPNGYEVIVARRDEDIPNDVIERNVLWANDWSTTGRDSPTAPGVTQ